MILTTGDTVGLEPLPMSAKTRPEAPEVGSKVTLDALEEAHIKRIVSAAKSLQEASETLGVDQATLWRKRKQYGL